MGAKCRTWMAKRRVQADEPEQGDSECGGTDGGEDDDMIPKVPGNVGLVRRTHASGRFRPLLSLTATG